MINTITLPPFKKMCVTIGNLPSSFVESMSYYEALCWMYNYLDKTVIPAINTEGEAITELQTAFITLKTYVDNYFDNLDVQEEINNKLDAMAESGELTDIIAQYLGLAGVLAYNTVADMKAAENLVNGSIAKTLGYHTLNDEGSAFYKIRTITNDDIVDERSIIALYDNTLIAELIEDNLNAIQYGCYGDGIHDDTENLQALINTNKKVTLNGTFKITNTLTIDVGLSKGVSGKGFAKILVDYSETEYDAIRLTNSLYSDETSIHGTCREFILSNLIVTDITEEYDTSATHYGNGITLASGCNHITLDNITISNFKNGLNIPSTSYGVYIDKFNNLKITNNDYGIYINSSALNNNGENLSFSKCTISTSKYGNNIAVDHYVNFVECSLDYNLGNTLIVKDGAVVGLTNCHIEWYASTPLLNVQNNSSLTFNSCVFYRTNYDDGGNNNYFITGTYADGMPQVIFNECSFAIKRGYTNLSESNFDIQFINCARIEYNPTIYCNPPLTIDLTQANNFVYPLNYDSGLTRNSTRVKVTCTTVKSSNKIYLPIDFYRNKDARITVVLNSSVDLTGTIKVGSGYFLGEAISFSTGAVDTALSLTAGTDKTYTIHHKFRKGLGTIPYIEFDIGALTQGATFEVKSISLQVI